MQVLSSSYCIQSYKNDTLLKELQRLSDLNLKKAIDGTTIDEKKKYFNKVLYYSGMKAVYEDKLARYL